jgi:hypothetical protein
VGRLSDRYGRIRAGVVGWWWEAVGRRCGPGRPVRRNGKPPGPGVMVRGPTSLGASGRRTEAGIGPDERKVV